MTGFKVVNLAVFVEEIGEDAVKGILSDFSCPLNNDVEYFLKHKAIDFAVQGWAQTHLVFASYKKEPVLVGYFTLANKYIRVSSKFLGKQSKSLRKRISKFSHFDKDLEAYILSAPLIAQLGKNYANGYNRLITGDELLMEACDRISRIQFDLGGRFAYVECEDKECLTSFYEKNGFCKFDKRELDADEADKLYGQYLIQLLKYIHKKK
jgi:hypothetical protein